MSYIKIPPSAARSQKNIGYAATIDLLAKHCHPRQAQSSAKVIMLPLKFPADAIVQALAKAGQDAAFLVSPLSAPTIVNEVAHHLAPLHIGVPHITLLDDYRAQADTRATPLFKTPRSNPAITIMPFAKMLGTNDAEGLLDVWPGLILTVPGPSPGMNNFHPFDRDPRVLHLDQDLPADTQVINGRPAPRRPSSRPAQWLG